MDAVSFPSQDGQHRGQPAKAGLLSAGARTPLRPSVLIPIFAVHLLAWEAYCAMSTATSSFDIGGAVLPVTALAAALLSAAAALVIGAHLRSPLRLVFIIVTVIALALPGIAEAAVFLLPDDVGDVDGFISPLLSALAMAVYVGILFYPLVISAVVVDALVGGRTGQGKADRQSAVSAVGLTAAVLVIVAAVALIGWTNATVFVGTGDESSVLYSQPDTVIAGCGAVIAVTVLFLTKRFGDYELSAAAVSALGILAYLTLASTVLLCSISTIQAVYTDATGIGGMLLWLGLVVVSPVLAMATAVASIIVAVVRRSQQA